MDIYQRALTVLCFAVALMAACGDQSQQPTMDPPAEFPPVTLEEGPMDGGAQRTK